MSELDDIRKRTEGHTPGPWEFDIEQIGSCGGRPYWGIVTPEVNYSTFIRVGVYADDYRGGPRREEECEANGALVGSAPDLLRIATEQEAELAQLRAERERLLECLGRIRPLAKSIALISEADEDAKDMADSIWTITIAALLQQEGGES